VAERPWFIVLSAVFLVVSLLEFARVELTTGAVLLLAAASLALYGGAEARLVDLLRRLRTEAVGVCPFCAERKLAAPNARGVRFCWGCKREVGGNEQAGSSGSSG
jgi:hypothetical protein